MKIFQVIAFLFVSFISIGQDQEEIIKTLRNGVGQPVTGNFYEGCDTLTQEKVFYDIVNSSTCECYSVDGDDLESRSCENVIPGECEDCMQKSDKEYCYGYALSNSEYQAPNEYEVTFIKGTMNWTLLDNTGAPSLELQSFMSDVESCLSGGNIATIEFYDDLGNVGIFEAESLTTPSGFFPANFTGNNVTGFIGYPTNMILSCAPDGSGSRQACCWIDACKKDTFFVDAITMTPLNTNQALTVNACPIKQKNPSLELCEGEEILDCKNSDSGRIVSNPVLGGTYTITFTGSCGTQVQSFTYSSEADLELQVKTWLDNNLGSSWNVDFIVSGTLIGAYDFSVGSAPCRLDELTFDNGATSNTVTVASSCAVIGSTSDKYALLSLGKNDDRRDSILQNLTIESTPLEIIEIPNGVSYTGTAARLINDTDVLSFTICKESGGDIQVSFDGGGSYPFIIDRNGCRTWGQGNDHVIDVSSIRVRGATGTSQFDINWETK